ncbi:MAG: hypothetical protein LBR65_03915 [Culturomica sp.]|jgi:hypothetical protein|nr:hypothetical protein [Culturomica sp.]
MFFKEEGAESYNWEEGGIDVLMEYDPVEGGIDGRSNVQAKTLALRTRNLHDRVKELEEKIAALEAALTK